MIMIMTMIPTTVDTAIITDRLIGTALDDEFLLPVLLLRVGVTVGECDSEGDDVDG
jgi:hypothetical protein